MEQTVYQFMERHHLVHRGATVLIGVSGGPDSMALLHMYKQLKDTWALEVIAVAVDHQLRGEEAREDIRFVQRQCVEWDIPFVSTQIDVKGYKQKTKVSTQVASRTLRYNVFTEQMKEHNGDYLALGHHGDDQVETMAMSFAHHSNTRSLAGIPTKRAFAGGHIVRPFLSISKEDIYAYCTSNTISFRVDPSNEDDSYERNYFRQHIVPLFSEQNPNLRQTMQHLSEHLHEDEKYLQAEAKKALEKQITFQKSPRKARFQKDEFLGLPIALQRRIFHLLLSYLYEKKVDGITYAHEEAFIALCKNRKPHVQVDLPHGCTIVKQYDAIHLFLNNKDEDPSYMYELPIPGEITLPSGDSLSASYIDTPIENEPMTYICDVKDIRLPLYVRTRKNGDRMSWKGLTGTKKLKDLFIDEKIPRGKREVWPILSDSEGHILWVVGLRKSHAEIDRSTERTYIAIQYKPV